MTTETVSGRLIPRSNANLVTHIVEFTDAGHIPGYRPGAHRVRCSCGWGTTIDGGHSDNDRARLVRMHAGVEDP